MVFELRCPIPFTSINVLFSAVMRMRKNITQRVLCLKVGKENINVTTLYEQSEEGEPAEEEDEGSVFPYRCSQ